MAITIAKIAELCGVSRGTVDRALNNKGNVRPEVCARIKQVAHEYGYTPNRAGRALVRARDPIRLGVVLHSAPTSFMQVMIGELHKAATDLSGFGVQVIFRLMDGMDIGDMLEKIDDLVRQEHINGLAITPLAHVDIQNKINDLTDRLHIPVVTFNSDVPNSKRMWHIGQDNVMAGRTAAGLMGLLLGSEAGKVLLITGDTMSHVAYTERVFGFSNELQVQFPHLRLLPALACADQGAQAEQAVLRVLQQEPDVTGIYVASACYEGVCRALAALGVQSKIKVVAHDLVHHNLVMARDQVLDFVIGQGEAEQASMPLRCLQEFLERGKRPTRTVQHTAIEVRFHYNITEQDCEQAVVPGQENL